MNRAVEKDGGFLTGMRPAHLWLAVTTAIKNRGAPDRWSATVKPCGDDAPTYGVIFFGACCLIFSRYFWKKNL